MLLVPSAALATIVHDDDVDITGELTVAGEVSVFGNSAMISPFPGWGGHFVVVRQGDAVSSGICSGFQFSNNQTSGAYKNIAQLMFLNEAKSGSDKRLAQILVQTEGVNAGRMLFRVYNGATGADGIRIDRDGDVTFYDEISAAVVEIRGGADMAELFNVQAQEVAPQPGMVVTIDREKPGALVVSSKAYDRTVAGIISGAGDLKPGMLIGQKGTLAYGDHPIALNGRAYCYVDATKGPVKPGDLLTTSDVPGHAMKVTDYEKAKGAIIGKAMTPLNSGHGLVMVLVSLQ
jgi:hypothetical protein